MRQRCGGHVPGSPGTTHPRGDVGPILLGLLEDAVVLGALRVGLDGHAVEALGKRAKHMSEMARAMRPLPSSKGWMVTNQRWARAARTTWLVSGAPLSHSRKAAISPGTRGGSGPSKWTLWRPMGPETTWTGSVRYSPVVMGRGPLRPVGNVSYGFNGLLNKSVSDGERVRGEGGFSTSYHAGTRATGQRSPELTGCWNWV